MNNQRTWSYHVRYSKTFSFFFYLSLFTIMIYWPLCLSFTQHFDSCPNREGVKCNTSWIPRSVKFHTFRNRRTVRFERRGRGEWTTKKDEGNKFLTLFICLITWHLIKCLNYAINIRFINFFHWRRYSYNK